METVGTALQKGQSQWGHGDSPTWGHNGDSPPKGTALHGDMGGQPSKRKIPQISFLRIG